MKYTELLACVSTLECFDLSLLVQAFPDPRTVIHVQLARWMKNGKVLGLRRGLYTLPAPYRRAPLNLASLANQLHRPSYLSGLWALSHHGLIPEHVVWLTSVTPRCPRHYENDLGVFDYRHLKRGAFFGYRSVPHGHGKVLVADPEKALLDHWYLNPGWWLTPRLTAMRYQNHDVVSAPRLQEWAARFNSPRLVRASELWLSMADDEREGTITL